MKLFKEFVEDLELDEVLGKDADMGDYIDDFKKSDSPQFKGRSEKKRKEMAIAAYLSKQREETELDEGKMKKGDTVIVLIGPHKGVKHKIIHDFGDGTYNVSPIGLSAKQIKYRLGAAKAKASELKKEYVNYPYGPLDTMRPMADLGDIPNYYGTKLQAQRKKKN